MKLYMYISHNFKNKERIASQPHYPHCVYLLFINEGTGVKDDKAEFSKEN